MVLFEIINRHGEVIDICDDPTDALEYISELSTITGYTYTVREVFGE